MCVHVFISVYVSICKCVRVCDNRCVVCASVNVCLFVKGVGCVCVFDNVSLVCMCL